MNDILSNKNEPLHLIINKDFVEETINKKAKKY